MNHESTISAQAFATLTRALVIDVRAPLGFAQQYVAGSLNIPLGEVGSEHINALVSDDQKPAYLLYGTGMRANKVADQLGHLVPHKLVVIAGGIQSLDAVGNPGFFFVSTFVGVGLCFAGITNTCGMGLMLVKIPRNTRGGAV